MIERIIDISEEPLYISVSNNLAKFKKKDIIVTSIPINEIACVVCSHPEMILSLHSLSAFAEEGVPVVICNEKYMPSAMLLPYASHFAQIERFAIQIESTKPMSKRLWQQVISVKIRMQGLLLEELYNTDNGLFELSKKVPSGDVSNREAYAAKIYWDLLKTDLPGGRDIGANDHNRLLNYGYAVLRAVVSRALCGAGLHPTIGIHHHNRYDQFCLADDLMEPLRPIIDKIIVGIVRKYGPFVEMSRSIKKEILSLYSSRILFHDEYRNIFDLCSKMSFSLIKVYEGVEKKLKLPDSLKLSFDYEEEMSKD